MKFSLHYLFLMLTLVALALGILQNILFREGTDLFLHCVELAAMSTLFSILFFTAVGAFFRRPGHGAIIGIGLAPLLVAIVLIAAT